MCAALRPTLPNAECIIILSNLTTAPRRRSSPLVPPATESGSHSPGAAGGRGAGRSAGGQSGAMAHRARPSG
eukprot:scaffold22169_cov157-Isochrysis_galbana.AAC.4